MLEFVCRLIATFLFGAAATGAWGVQPKRVALVIGNGAYQHTSPLVNPTNDAADMAAALNRLGFEVVEGRDLDESGMRRTIKRFAERLTGADVGLFFYAGHGLQVGGHNYLVPVDAKLDNAAGLDFELIRLDVVHRTMERETKTNVIFLDACRDNPLSRNLARSMGTRSSQIGKGLAVVESGVGTLISFSTQPGNTALDGDGRNSPFAGSLVKHIANPKDDLSTLLINVRNEVMAATRDQQIPWEHSALRSKFYFAGLPPREPANPAEPSHAYGAELAARAEELRKAVEEARLAREAAKAADEQRLAAVKAAEEARKHSERAIPDKQGVETQSEPSRHAGLPKSGKPDDPFRGSWQVRAVSDNCKIKGWAFALRTGDGAITGLIALGNVTGSVSASGQIKFSHPSGRDGVRDGGTNSYSGSIRGTSGSGTFYRGPTCSGTFTMTRL